jgi:hypothetical protein
MVSSQPSRSRDTPTPPNHHQPRHYVMILTAGLDGFQHDVLGVCVIMTSALLRTIVQRLNAGERKIPGFLGKLGIA